MFLTCLSCQWYYWVRSPTFAERGTREYKDVILPRLLLTGAGKKMFY